MSMQFYTGVELCGSLAIHLIEFVVAFPLFVGMRWLSGPPLFHGLVRSFISRSNVSLSTMFAFLITSWMYPNHAKRIWPACDAISCR
jgi:hypothetical protein